MYSNVLIAVLIVIAFWLLKNLFPASHRPKLTQTAQPGSADQKPYRAASVHAYSQGCEAVQALKGCRFLSRDTPLLPLEGCNSKECHCVYVHHVDRRSGNGGRRCAQSFEGNSAVPPGQMDRRKSEGRRASDRGSQLALA